MWELFFAFFLEVFEEIAVSAETVFAGDRIFEKEGFEWLQSKSHIATEENEETNAREVGENVPHRSQADDSVEGGLAQDDGGEKGSDIQGEDGFFSEFSVSVENGRNEDYEHEEAHELGAEIVGVFAIVVAIVQSPEEGRGDGDFNMFPSGFINC